MASSDISQLYKNIHPRTHQDNCEHKNVFPYGTRTHKYGSIRLSVPKNSIVTDTRACCKVQSAKSLQYMNSMDSLDFLFSSRHHMFLCNQTNPSMHQSYKMFHRYKIQSVYHFDSRLDIPFGRAHCQLVYFVEYNYE